MESTHKPFTVEDENGVVVSRSEWGITATDNAGNISAQNPGKIYRVIDNVTRTGIYSATFLNGEEVHIEAVPVRTVDINAQCSFDAFSSWLEAK